MIYLDTSYIVKCYLREPGTEAILAWLQGRSGLACSLHGRLELCAAIKRHVQEGRLSHKSALASLRLLENDERSSIWHWIPVSEDLIYESCRRIALLPPASFVRAADALHLTCAAANGFASIYSHDRHLLAAAEHFGLQGLDILQNGV